MLERDQRGRFTRVVRPSVPINLPLGIKALGSQSDTAEYLERTGLGASFAAQIRGAEEEARLERERSIALSLRRRLLDVAQEITGIPEWMGHIEDWHWYEDPDTYWLWG